MEAVSKLFLYLYRIRVRVIRKIIEKICLRIEGGQFFSQTIRQIYSKYYGLHIGYGSYGGCFAHENFPAPCDITFGRYCSIGSNVKVFRANHPASNFTTSPVLYNPILGFVNKDLLERPSLQVGNDVWIGSSVIILPGCKKIGDGVIIGAGSIVTHDIEPFSIVAGNPAKIIRKRFNEQQAALWYQSKWWLYDYNELKQHAQLLNQEIHSLS